MSTQQNSSQLTGIKIIGGARSGARSQPKAAEGPDPRSGRDRLTAIYERGLERCRSGNWQEGLVDLAWLAENDGRTTQLPALCYSYLGYGLARYRGQIQNGIKLCKYAIKLEFFQPECYINLARASLLIENNRREAAEAVLEGLKIDPDYPELIALQRELGVRRRPVVSFLSRKSLVNRLLGWFRHRLARRQKRPDAGPPPEINTEIGALDLSSPEEAPPERPRGAQRPPARARRSAGG